MFALKDTQESNAKEVKKEFTHKTEALLQETENFLTSMFRKGITFAPFPSFGESNLLRGPVQGATVAGEI